MKVYINRISKLTLILFAIILLHENVMAQIVPPVRSIGLTASNPTYNLDLGEVSSISIVMDNPTAIPINGFTAVLTYDPALIQVNDVIIDNTNPWIILADVLTPGQIYISYGLLGGSTSQMNLDLFEIEVEGITDDASAHFDFVVEADNSTPYTEIASNGYGVLDSADSFIVSVNSCPLELEIFGSAPIGSFVAESLIFTEINSAVIISSPTEYNAPTVLLDKGFEVLIGNTFETILTGCN